MAYENIPESEAVATALAAVNKYIDTLFDRAPVMMHSIDRDWKIIKVNRRWLQRLGYESSEVLGRTCTDFLTEESRSWAVKDTLPLFWRVGSARSIGYQFVKKDGEIVDVLLDADVSPTAIGEPFSYAAIRKAHDLTQWEEATTTLTALQQLSRVRLNFERILSGREGPKPDPDLTWVPAYGSELDVEVAKETLGKLLELGQDVSMSLRGLLRVQEEWLGATAEQHRELLLVARNIDKTLVDMGDSMARGPSKPA